MNDERIIDEEDIMAHVDELIQPDFVSPLDRGRPYSGQPHTALGERGKEE